MEVYSVMYFALGRNAAKSQVLRPSVCLTSEGSGGMMGSYQPGTLEWGALEWSCPEKHNLENCGSGPSTSSTCAINKQMYQLGKDRCKVSEAARQARVEGRHMEARMLN